ncbi:MAG TPA: acyl-CoA dehydrogenase family protein [Baekduia sp.]|uniref:acyl-CoA dehydrogenase family protein n=1 Tax=Baekduia sp. TaxID=2600305 RepID=UPI002BB878AE|nr:acyl-CoA dehydrogenase family protein [Baekduia sp.]HMJ34448.1 acyl-CoA dehydrogenase family protein [Baekduia sp.]
MTITTPGPELALRPIAGGPGAPAEDEWIANARALAAEFATDIVERERAGEPPLAEAQRLRDSGLLALLAPASVGGHGRPYRTALQVVRTLAQVDSGVARLLAYHLTFQDRMASDLEDPARYRDLQRRSVEHDWIIGSTGSPLDTELVLTPTLDGFRINGTKSFATTARVADRILGFVKDPGSGHRLIVEIDPADPGLDHLEDWDILGERLSASNGLVLTEVEISRDAVLADTGPDEDEKPPHRTVGILSFQLVFIHLYLGIAEGALLAAREYTRTRTRPWVHASVEEATEDPHILNTYGELVSRVQALGALAERAEAAVAWALERGPDLTARERGEAATLGAAAKVVATQVVLDTTSRVFETTGARSAKLSVGLDRFWRNARTETLHSPVAYKIEEVGRSFLNDTIAKPSEYR